MKLNITKHLEYREIIKIWAKQLKISQKSLAQSAGIHTSYFSRVMSDGTDFSPSQLYLIGKDLGLQEWELDYFLLLGEHSSSGNHSHKSFLKSKIIEIQEKRSKVISEMKDVDTEFSEEYTREYYREAVTAKVHMFLTIEKFRKNPILLCQKILIPEFKLQIELEKLHTLGIIEILEDEIRLIKFNVHLDESSSISPNNHINWRLESISTIQKRTPRPSDYHMSAVFSTDENGKIRIKELFKKFILDAQKVASQVKDQEDVFHLGFDLY
jgi:transcriptional regulator with XRE-family HTH domain